MKPRKILRLAALAALIIGALLLASCAVLPFLFTQASPSMGIIGGADGPTAILVATSTGLQWDVLLAALLLVAGVVGLIVTRTKR